ncbi:MAG: fumarylacetoacetate hydrolase family protein [Oligoflexia bacterium]|nr:fumarylacetoacetate hydrolase family protein [Oligoflexia bacterium]
MAVKIVRFEEKKGIYSWAYVKEGVAYPCLESFDRLDGFLKIVDQGKIDPKHFSPSGMPVNSLRISSPISSPCQIICQGKNYLDHKKETGVSLKSSHKNILFTKAPSSIASAYDALSVPQGVSLLDYEIELGLLIGKPIKKELLSDVDPLDYIAGVFIANDVSARDIQVPHRQWFRGKSYRGFCPLGPYLVLLEKNEKEWIYDLNLELKVNGSIRQKSSTSLMLHEPRATLREISEIFDLYPGDILLTGTPGGVAMRVAPKSFWQKISKLWVDEDQVFSDFIEQQKLSDRYLKEGDIVEAKIYSDRLDLGEQKFRISAK